MVNIFTLDQILKKMPTEVEAVRRCVESSEKIKELEEEIMSLKSMISSLEAELRIAGNSTGYYTTTGTGTYWGDNTVTVGYCQTANSISAADSTSYSTTTATTTWQ